MFRIKTILCFLQSFLMLVSSFSVYDSNFKRWVDRAAMELTSVTDFGFEAISADEMAVSDAEKEKCRSWYNANILTSENPAYDFTVDGKSLQANTADWDFSIGEESAVGEVYSGGKTTYITVSHKKSDLVATIEATIYEDYATCEWTVFIENTGDENSPVVKKFYAMDTDIDTGVSDIYFSKGSASAKEDFELMKSAVCITPMIFNANGGRTDSFMPYFNICGKNGGVVVTNGWTGQWYSSFRQNGGSVSIIEKQEKFNGYLTAGEEVRSPLVSLTFYDGDNALKGFNTFRSWQKNCVIPAEAASTHTNWSVDTTSSDSMVYGINSLSDEEAEKIDIIWVDAVWYQFKENDGNWFNSVGNWACRDTFPDGFKPVSEAAANRDMKLMVWLEAERCAKDTIIYNAMKDHEGWLWDTGDEDRYMINLANEEAFDYITNYVLNFLTENGISILRLDCALAPYDDWREMDDVYFDGRAGFEENHYVTNLYRYYDTMISNIPGLYLDNCCSGGRRLDTELARRSIPLWRTDYNCLDEEGQHNDDIHTVTQAHTYGISFWYPVEGIAQYYSGEYADRSCIIPCTFYDTTYNEIREYTLENYYPLDFGGTDNSEYLAMQFGDENEGIALIYKRDNVTDSEYRLVMNGLSPEKSYTVYDFDGVIPSVTKTGDELMSEGITLQINDTPKAVIMQYSVA